MSTELIAKYLYQEILIVTLILLAICLRNNIRLYQLKLKDYLSLMLISSIVVCLSELAWDVFDGNPEFIFLNYVIGGIYVCSSMIACTIFNRYFLDRFQSAPATKTGDFLFYVAPNLLIFGLCLTTYWTGWIISVGSDGWIRLGFAFDYIFNALTVFYLLSVILFAIYHSLTDRRKDKDLLHTSNNLVIFGILVTGTYAIQVWILKEASEVYLSLSLAWAVGLVFLTTVVNTKSLVDKQAQIDAVASDLRIATRIQQDALPPVDPTFENHIECHLRASMDTAREVGGDFYDYFAIDDQRLAIVIADVSGKGVPAALFMMTMKTMIKDYALMTPDTSEVLTAINQRLCEGNEEQMFATVWMGIYDRSTSVMEYTNAGHNYPLFMHKGEECVELRHNHGPVVTGIPGLGYKKDLLPLKAGDRLLLYTDGITEAHNQKEELYGEERLIQTFDKVSDQNGEDVLRNILKDVNEYAKGVPQFDDMTMMILTIK